MIGDVFLKDKTFFAGKKSKKWQSFKRLPLKKEGI
jgi:hypothetical protein